MTTNASRVLTQRKIQFDLLEYDTSDGRIDGLSVSEKTEVDPNRLFKTLVCQGEKMYVFVIPVNQELPIKVLKKKLNDKKLDLLDLKLLKQKTGYEKGGCSPIGMKTQYQTYISSSALSYDKIVFSAGKIGVQVEMNPKDLEKIMKINWFEV